jgi:hypothetical protein
VSYDASHLRDADRHEHRDDNEHEEHLEHAESGSASARAPSELSLIIVNQAA